MKHRGVCFTFSSSILTEHPVELARSCEQDFYWRPLSLVIIRVVVWTDLVLMTY